MGILSLCICVFMFLCICVFVCCWPSFWNYVKLPPAWEFCHLNAVTSAHLSSFPHLFSSSARFLNTTATFFIALYMWICVDHSCGISFSQCGQLWVHVWMHTHIWIHPLTYIQVIHMYVYSATYTRMVSIHWIHPIWPIYSPVENCSSSIWMYFEAAENFSVTILAVTGEILPMSMARKFQTYHSQKRCSLQMPFLFLCLFGKIWEHKTNVSRLWLWHIYAFQFLIVLTKHVDVRWERTLDYKQYFF